MVFLDVIKYVSRKCWQRSIRNVYIPSRCRHARTYKKKGFRFKGGK